MESNAGLEGTFRNRRLANEDRKWERKCRMWEAEKKAVADAEEEEQRKRRKVEETVQTQVKAQQVVFKPSDAALIDPKAYFQQWQQFSGSVASDVRRSAQASPAKGKGKGQASATATGSPAPRQASTQACSSPIATAKAMSRPAGALWQSQDNQRETTLASGLGGLGAYASDDE
mmetsp:Transcript_66783/g.159780  ORF Transcript_66783/g.159780 Transcript_66783/m.159780 type:complete len:174 (-) Transcript_66783:108-629(-)|eukprot:CAMPEP_0178382432 /NCGR_PEP_ID=MMETSP0689_2-20121128/6489_1 /TAXON_ID=160604 /ORGANISM="Amphidinium massartii, Strain CS-259" /LENGTH=173 /DNA_ID=CAMNT_0020002633 /DNA_START=53 /DNA_END=574 /DNA_ORIENTATION=-